MQEISVYTEGDRVDLICLGQEVGSEKAAINLFNRYKSEATALYGGKWRSEDKGHAELKLPYGSVECSYGMYDSGIYSVEMRIYDKGNDWKEILTISKFVVPVNGKELYIRRKPDNNSPYFVFVEDEENGPGLMGPEGEHCWDKNTFKRSLVKPYGVPVLGVVGEIGNWYKVYLSSWFHWDYVSEVGYVQKSACKDAKLLPLTNKEITSGVRTFGHVRTSGKYKGMVLTWGCSSLLRPCVAESFQYGKVLNSNVLLLNKVMDYWINTDDKKIRLNGTNLLWEITGSFNDYVVEDEEYGVRGKLEILSDFEIQSVTERPYYDPTPYEAYFHLEGESTLYGICLEPSKELKVFVNNK